MLGWSINLFKVFGIQLAVHATFFLLLAYAAYDGWVAGGPAGLAWRVMLTTLFFVCVILHELGHSLTAQRYGVKVPRILLLPIGGMAEMDQIPRKPSAEMLITIAGPAVNFLLVALLLPLSWHALFDNEAAGYSVSSLLGTLCYANLMMGIFNMIPVYPMDGGRILRSLLAVWLPYMQATWWAVMIARVLAPILAFVAFYYLDWPMLGVLFLFILWAGSAEYRHLLRREQEDAYWAEMARRATMVTPVEDEPPLLIHGPN
jgi:Zn-dependent protease